MKRTAIVMLGIGLFFFAHEAQAQWTPTKRITWTWGNSEYPAVAVDSLAHLHVVWDDDTPGNNEIYYKKSEDGGDSWSAVRRITWTSGGSYAPAIAVDSSDHLHVVWYDDSPGSLAIHYKRSEDGGDSWTASQRITWSSANSFVPAIAVDASDHLHVVWDEYASGNAEIFYKKSDDGGDSWLASRRITWTSENSQHAAIAVDASDHLHVVWHDLTPGNEEVYYKKSEDGGDNWTAVQRLTWTSDSSLYPAIAVDSLGHLHVVWYDATPGNCEIYYRRSEDGGDSWTAARRLTWTSGTSWLPAIAVDSLSHLHVVWDDVTPGNYEVYYKRSEDGGDSWTAVQRLTWTSGPSQFPAIAVDSSDRLHVVWHDLTPGNREIYYKKKN